MECERLDLSPTTHAHLPGADRADDPARARQVPAHPLNAKQLDDLYGAMKDGGQDAEDDPQPPRHHLRGAPSGRPVGMGPTTSPRRPSRRGLAAPGEGASVDVVRRVIEAAEERDPRLAALLMLGALTGMRRGELCALRWSDVDLERGTIEVCRSVVVVPEVRPRSRPRRTAPARSRSTRSALRCSSIPRPSRRVGSRGRDRVADDAFVFSLTLTVPRLPSGQRDRLLHPGPRRLGLEDVRLHDLRHFTATQLIGAGVDVRTVAGRLGHSDPSLTLRVYSHVRGAGRAAAAIMGEVLQGESRPSLRDAAEG